MEFALDEMAAKIAKMHPSADNMIVLGMASRGVPLAQKLSIFDYATQYCRTHPTLAAPSEFEITDSLYDDFCRFLKEKKLTYNTATEHMIKQLREVAAQEKYDTAIEQQLKLMEAALEKEKQGDLQKHREEVCEMLKAELLVRYYYDRGRIEGALKNDKAVLRAVEELAK